MNKEYEKEHIINEIKKSKEEISSIWNNLNISNIQRLEEIWKDDITEEYINKYKNIDSIINSIVSNLEKLEKDLEEKTKILEDKM